MYSNPKATDLFNSIAASWSDGDRRALQWLLEQELTQEAAMQLLREGLHEPRSTWSTPLPNSPILFTELAAKDLNLFGAGPARKQLESVLASLQTEMTTDRCQRLPGGDGWLLRSGPFCSVFGKEGEDLLVVAVACAGICPTAKVWRYLDQHKAEDLLKTGCLYFCRLDQLTDDPREARLTELAKQIKIQAYQAVFDHKDAPKIVGIDEEFSRSTTYVCSWTRRKHESYLAWKHYCSGDGPGGGFAVVSDERRICHLSHALKSKDDQTFCQGVEYLDPFSDDQPNKGEGAAVFCKSHWFSDETEVRFAVMRRGNGREDEDEKTLKRIKEEKPLGEWIACDLGNLVQEIVISPFASAKQERSLKEIMEKFRPELANRVRESGIRVAERRLAS